VIGFLHLYASEYVSLIWTIIFMSYATVVFYKADKDNNKNLYERMTAYIFAAVFLTTYTGAMAPKYFCFVLDIGWYSGSHINQILSTISMVTAWAIFRWGCEWLAWMTAACLIFGGLTWLTTRILLPWLA